MFTFKSPNHIMTAARTCLGTGTVKAACLAVAVGLPFWFGAPATADAQEGQGQAVPLSEQQGRNPLDPVQNSDPSVEASKPDWLKKAKDNDPTLRDGVPLEKPHLTPREVREWASNAVADVLNFSFTDFAERQKTYPKYFSSQGWEQYQEYMRKSRMEEVINSYKYDVSGVVVNIPYIAREEARQGVYRWLVEVPVMMSYLDEKQQSELAKDRLPLTDDLLVTIEIARVPTPKLTDEERAKRSMMDSMDVVIHTWTVKTRKRR